LEGVVYVPVTREVQPVVHPGFFQYLEIGLNS
jgi:hypothetical protein